MFKRLKLKIVGYWDWWIYCRAIHSLRRMYEREPGFAYLFELQIRKYREGNTIPLPLGKLTERYFDAMQILRKEKE